MKDILGKSLVFALFTVLTVSVAKADPLIRFWKGFQKDGITESDFLSSLNQTLIPATAALGTGKTGLIGYLPVVVPRSAHGEIPDEFALVVYESSDKYKTFRATPEGLAYGDLHWEMFDRAKSASAVAIRDEQSFAIGQAFSTTDYQGRWDEGYARFTLIRRNAEIDDAAYIENVKYWLGTSNNEGMNSGRGKLGRVVLVERDYIAAYDLWTDRESYEKRSVAEIRPIADLADYHVNESGVGALIVDIELPKTLTVLNREQGLQAPLAP